MGTFYGIFAENFWMISLLILNENEIFREVLFGFIWLRLLSSGVLL
jgi:hypothetical protein